MVVVGRVLRRGTSGRTPEGCRGQVAAQGGEGTECRSVCKVAAEVELF